MQFNFWHDYQFRETSWINFTFFHLYFERAKYSGISEIDFAILGLNFNLSWTHDPTALDKLRDHINAVVDARPYAAADLDSGPPSHTAIAQADGFPYTDAEPYIGRNADGIAE